MHQVKKIKNSSFGILVLAVLLLVAKYSFAQKSEMDKQTIIENRVEYLLENTDQTEGDYTTLFAQLNEFYEHPLNLNHASREDLEALGLLNDVQINNLLLHIKKYGNLLNLEELQTINGFDENTIDLILPFVKVSGNYETNNLQLKNIAKNAKASLFLRYQQVLEQQKGYLPISDSALAASPNSRYLGSPAHLYTRFKYKYGRKLDFGITAEKDAGEQFFKGNEKQGFDFYSAHFFLRNQGWLKQLAVGDFQAQFGQGLTMYSGRAFGFSSDIYAIKKNAEGLVPYSSVDENNFLRGGGASVGIKNFTFTGFYSSHKIDANIAAPDTSGFVDENVTTITSLQTTGLHRTPGELEDKHAIQQNIGGLHIKYVYKNLQLGLTGVNLDTKANLEAQTQPYNQFYKGTADQTNLGINYNYVVRNINIFGETAHNLNYGFATVNGLLIMLDPKLSLTVLQRYYQKNYQPFLSNAISQNSYDNDESGLYFGVKSDLSRSLSFTAYADQYRFPWLSYERDAPSSGNEYLAQLTYKPSRSFEVYFRLKQRNRQRNSDDEDLMIPKLVKEQQVNYRLNITYTISKTIKLKSRAEFVDYHLGTNPHEKGVLLYQDVIFKSLKSPFSFALRYALFQTDSYNARIYAYEDNVLYAYSIPAYYYRGSRAYITLRYTVNRNIDCWFRIAQTVYDNKNTVGSGNDEIDGPAKTEITAQLRFKF